MSASRTLEHLNDSLTATALRGMPDTRLLQRFTAGDEHAFAALVERHGPLVRGVCRRVLRDATSADDAFQATFLALARQATTIHGSAAGWLHGVAQRVSRKLIEQQSRRRRREEVAASLRPEAGGPQPWDDLLAVLDEELLRLPERLREPLTCCYLEGRTQDEAARELGWSIATLRRRLDEGRELLKARLTRRGVTLSAALLGATVALPKLDAATIGAAVAVAAAQQRGDAIPPALASLLRPRWPSSTKGALVLATALAAGAISLGLMPERRPEPPARPSPGAEALSDGAVARVGSPRFRHAGSLWAARFSPDGRTVVTGEHGVGLNLWDAQTGKLKRRIELPTAWFGDVVFTPDGKTLVLVDGKETLRRIDAETGREPFARELKPTSGPQSVAMSPDGKGFAIGRSDKTVRIHDEVGNEVRVIRPAMMPQKLAYSADGRALAIGGSGDGAVRVFDVRSGALLRRSEYVGRPDALAIAGDGQTLAAAWDSGTATYYSRIALWNFAGSDKPQELHDGSVRDLALSPDGKRLAVAGICNGVSVRDARTGAELRRLQPGVLTERVTFAPDGKTLLIVSRDDAVTLWDVDKGEMLPSSADRSTRVDTLAFVAGGRHLQVRSEKLELFDWSAGRLISAMPAPAKDDRPLGYRGDPPLLGGLPSAGASVSPDGRLLVVPADHCRINVIDTRTGEVRRTLQVADQVHPVGATSFSADGNTLFIAAPGGNIQLWDVATWRLSTTLERPWDVGDEFLALSPDGRYLAAGSRHPGGGHGQPVRVWDISAARIVHTLYPEVGPARAIAFSPDSRLLAVAGGSDDPTKPAGEVKIWDVQTGRCQRSLTGHAERVAGVAFSPDGRLIATGGFDRTARVWELATGQERTRFNLGGAVSAVAFSPDGRHLATADPVAPILVWDLHAARPRREGK